MPDEKIDGLSPYSSAKGALYLIAKAVIVGICSAIFFMFMARYLPNISDLGLFQGLQSLITVSVTLAGTGLSRASIRFISSYIGAGMGEVAESIYSAVFRIGVMTCGLLSVTLYLLAPYIAELLFHESNYAHLVRLTSIDVFLFGLILYITSLLYAMQSFRTAVLISIINSSLKLALAVILVLAGMSIEGFIIGFILGDIVSLPIYLLNIMPKIRRRPSSIHEIKATLAYSLPLYGSSILFYLSTEMDIYVLLIMTDLSVVGLYSPAVFLGTMLLLGLTAIDQSLAPLYSRIYGKMGIKPLEGLSVSASRYIFLIYLPLAIFVLCSTPVILTTFLGDRYYPSIYPSIIIIGAITSTILSPVFNNILISAGYARVLFIAGLCAISSELILSFILIPEMKEVGAAIARSTSFIIMFLIPAYSLKQRLGALPYDKKALLSGLFGSIIIASVIFPLNLYLFSKFYDLPFIVLLAIGSYLLFLRYVRVIQVKDIETLNKVFSGKATWLMSIIARVVVKGGS